MNRCQRENAGVVAVSVVTDGMAVCAVPVKRGRVEFPRKRGVALTNPASVPRNPNQHCGMGFSTARVSTEEGNGAEVTIGRTFSVGFSLA